MTYRIRDRDITVEAFQLTEPQYHSRTGWPAWLRAALPRMRQGTLMIRTPHGLTPLYVNDWVIRDKNGALWVQEPGPFADHYEAVS